MNEGSSSLNLRQSNRLRIIDTLYRNPAIGRSELARRTGLSRPTVATVIDELRRADVIEEQVAEGRRQMGRPAVLLSLMPGAAFAVGVELDHLHVRVAVCDLAGELVVDYSSPADVDGEPRASLDLTERLVHDALQAANVAPERMLGVGIGFAAPINKLTGDVQADGALPDWKGIRPAAEMQARLGLPVRVENNANVGALGEKLFGAARGSDDFVYVSVSTGIGAGLILSGRPHPGSSGIAGEIGHVVVDDRGLICRCGNRGCLETIASPVAIAALMQRSNDDNERVTVQHLLRLVTQGDRRALRAVADAGAALGRVLAILANALNPELVVIGGDLAIAGETLLNPIRAAIDDHSVPAAATTVSVITSSLGGDAEILGAVALILDDLPHALVQRVGH